MGRLIDADDVISLLANHHFDGSKENTDLLIHNLCKEVKSVPTAYDPDKVAEQLENLKTINVDIGFGTLANTLRKEVVLDIVKGGGVDGN